jgi:hypothetical protein
MKSKKTILAALAALVLIPAVLAAADKPKGDKASFIGTWTVSLGIYQDGSKETELEMEFAFTDKTLTNPMDGSELAWTIDEKAKTISATGASGAMTLGYKVVNADTVELGLLKVKKDAKETVVVGDKGTFKSLTLARKK